MNIIFQELLHKGILANYMDDFIILAKTKKKSEKKIIQSILKVVGREEVQIENKKVETVKEWKISTKIKEVKSFLGFTNFYRCFIKTFKELKDKITS